MLFIIVIAVIITDSFLFLLFSFIVNLGKWVLRYLFAKFTQAEIQTYDEIHQQRQLMQQQRQGNRYEGNEICRNNIN